MVNNLKNIEKIDIIPNEIDINYLNNLTIPKSFITKDKHPRLEIKKNNFNIDNFNTPIYNKYENNYNEIKSTFNYLDKEKLKYELYSTKALDNQNNFLKYLRIHDKKNNYLYKLNKLELKNIYNEIFQHSKQKSFNILDEIQDTQLDTGLFITLTLNTQWHKYSNKGKSKNERYDELNTIKKGYKLLNKIFREIQKQMAADIPGGNIYKFVKVIEPHKDFTPHLHALLLINKDNINKIINIIKNKIDAKDDTNITYTIKNNKDDIDKDVKKYKKYELNYNAKNTKKEIGRSEIEIIDNKIAAINYLLKYIMKMLKDENKALDGWKRKNKIRLITTSNTQLPLYIYKKLFKTLDKIYINNNISLNKKDDDIYNKNERDFIENNINEIDIQKIKLKDNLINDKINFLTYFKQNTFIEIEKNYENGKTKYKHLLNENEDNYLFYVYVSFNFIDNKRYIDQFIIEYDGQKIFDKNQFYTFKIKPIDENLNDIEIIDKYINNNYFNDIDNNFDIFNLAL